MKKTLLLISALLLLTNIDVNKTFAENDLQLDSSLTTVLTNQLKNGIELNADITFNYDNLFSSLKIIDQIDSTNRSNFILIDNEIVQESYLQATSLGGTVEKYLTISNTIETREVTTSSGEAVSFKSTYGSPFITLSSLNNKKINSYFEITQDNNQYILKANDLGYGILANSLLDFYYDYDSLVWDSSYTRSIENLTLTLNENGLLQNVSFNKIKKDIFGGIKENYNIAISSLTNNVKNLEPLTSSLNDDQKTTFENKMNNFQTLLNNGNFTHSIQISVQDNILSSYSNYYSLNEDSEMHGMICSLPLQDSSHGETYISVFNTGGTYSTVGISPDDDYSGTIKELETLDIKEIIPQVSNISSAFFTYDETNNLYTFDFDNFIYDDTHFSSTLLISLFGAVDPSVHNLGLYTYNGSSYLFDSLSIGFDESNYLKGTLTYSYYGFPLTCSFSFKNVGETNLQEQDDISKVIEYLNN